jgi:AcrR family transcriptional regulator
MAARRPRRAGRSAGAAKGGAGAEAGRDEDRVVDAALALIAKKGWRETTLADIAAASGLGLARTLPRFPSKTHVLAAFQRRLDRATLAAPPEADATVRDRLFELFMRRFDALQVERAALARLARELPADPCAALGLAPGACGGVRAIAETAGVDTAGALGLLRLKGLAAVYAFALRAWLADDSPDLAKTMKALDAALARAEMLARSWPGARRSEKKAA